MQDEARVLDIVARPVSGSEACARQQPRPRAGCLRPAAVARAHHAEDKGRQQRFYLAFCRGTRLTGVNGGVQLAQARADLRVHLLLPAGLLREGVPIGAERLADLLSTGFLGPSASAWQTGTLVGVAGAACTASREMRQLLPLRCTASQEGPQLSLAPSSLPSLAPESQP